MIQVNNINGKPETTPKKYYASAADSQFFYFFETEAEEQAWLAALPTVFNLDLHKAEIEAAVDEMVANKLSSLNYTNFKGEPSIGDVSAGVTDTEAEWHLEAVEVNKWYSKVYAELYDYLQSVTEQTALPVADFIASLPQFENS